MLSFIEKRPRTNKNITENEMLNTTLRSWQSTHPIGPKFSALKIKWAAQIFRSREDANSKLVEVVTAAKVDDEDRAGNSLLQIWELRS